MYKIYNHSYDDDWKYIRTTNAYNCITYVHSVQTRSHMNNMAHLHKINTLVKLKDLCLAIISMYDRICLIRIKGKSNQVYSEAG